MECRHNVISFVKGFPHCLDCGRNFKNGELAKIRKQIESECNHSNLDYGYASNPPCAFCPDCGGYFRY
jgi:hypothetical protein